MATESDWMGLVEQHTAGSTYEHLRRLAADMETAIAALSSAVAEGRRQSEAIAAEHDRSLENFRSHLEDVIASAVLKITASFDGDALRRAQANAQRDARIAELTQRFDRLDAPVPTKEAATEPLAAELVQILERARGQNEP